MDGEITCQSTLGEGSKFKVWLPLTSSTGEMKQSGLTISPQMRKVRIILAEDDKNNICVFIQILELLGYVLIDVVRSGKELVERVNHKKYDIIFTDDKMPEMGGMEAAKIIKESHPDSYIVAITANAIYGDKERYLKIMDDYIAKPIAITEMVMVFDRFRKRLK